jgi:hypothetical protein
LGLNRIPPHQERGGDSVLAQGFEPTPDPSRKREGRPDERTKSAWTRDRRRLWIAFAGAIADGIDSGVLRTVTREGDCFFAVPLAMTIPYRVIML